MKILTFLVFLFVSTVCFAHVGISSEKYKDTIRNRILNVKILYPTSTLPTEIFAQNVAFYGFKASLDSSIEGKKLPLYIIAHGTSGNWKNLSWLANKLANDGAIVVIANHPNYTSGEASPQKVIRMWDQAKDISFLVDKILEGSYQKYINDKDITVIGYSLGGYSALALAGVKLDIKRYMKFCETNIDNSCKYFKNAFSSLTSVDFINSSKSYKDNRIKKIISIAPGFVPAMKDKSLKGISIPTLVIGAQYDKNVPAQTQLEPYLKNKYQNVLYEKVKGAGHFSFMQKCTDKAIPILKEEKASFVCMESSTINRRAIHDKLYEIVTAFIKEAK